MKRLLVFPLLIALIVGLIGGFGGQSSDLTAAQRFALRVDAVLDGLEKPRVFAYELEGLWPYEVFPYFNYENLTNQAIPPRVVFEVQGDGARHVHLAGYTYCENEVYLNARYINPVSVWYEDADALVTLVHEMIHTLGQDFCNPWDSEKTESSTQIATLEVLAAMANHGNEVAYYALLDELRSIAMNTALYEAMQENDLAGYREFRSLVFQEEGLARFDKSQRYWANDQATLNEILKKYSVDVFHAVQHGRFQVDLPGDQRGTTIYGLDDLRYVINHLPRK